MTGSVQSHDPTTSLAGLAGWGVVAAATALIVAGPVATWWLVGDQSTVPVSGDPDYAFRPFDITAGTERTVGIGSTMVAVLAFLALAWATRRHRLEARWWMVLAPLVSAGLIAGFGWRVLTAGVIGANIGAGFMVLLGGPAVTAMLIWAMAYSIRLSHRSRRARVHPVGPGRA